MAIDLQEMRDRKSFAEAEWRDNFNEGDVDQRYLTGHPFEPEDEILWKKMYGPAPIATDQLSSHVNRVSNHVLAKPRGIKVHQATQRATPISAADRNDIIRGIEYTGGAQVAMLMAYRSMIETGIGVLGLTKDYKPGSRHMEMKYRTFANRRQVLVDPTIVQPDGSDMQWSFVNTIQPKKEFQREYGKDAKADMVGFWGDGFVQAAQWFQNLGGVDYVVKSEYWNIEKKREKLFYLDTPNGPMDMSESMIKAYGMGWNGEYLVKQNQFGRWIPWARLSQVPVGENPWRTEEVPEVTCYITNGYDVLEQYKWDTRQIPLVLMLGKQIFLTPKDGRTQRQILSLIRLARQPYLALCYVRSKQMLLAGMAPLAPWQAIEGQLSADEGVKYANSHRVMTGVLYYKPQLDHIVNPDGSKPLLPPPQRIGHEIEIQELEIMAQSLIRDCSTAMGFANIPSAMLDDKQKSGKALENITEMVDQGSSHFIDTYDKAGKQCGVIINEEIDYLAATSRDFVAITPDQKKHVLTVGANAIDPRTKQPRLIDLGLAEDHDITISVGPSADSLEDETEKTLEEIMDGGAMQLALQANPGIAGKVVGATLRGRDLGPSMDAVADLFDPQDENSPAAQAQQLSAKAAQQEQQLQVAGLYIEKLESRNQKLESGIEKQVVANAGDEQVARIKQETDVWKAQFEAMLKAIEEGRAIDRTMFEHTLADIRAELDHARAKEAMVAEAALQPEPEPVAESAGQ